MPSNDRKVTERWFQRRGVPFFIVDYNAAEDVFTRAAPVLTLVFLFSAISAIDLDWPTAGIVLASIGGLVLLISAWILLNKLRGRRLLAPPERIGRIELAAFVLVPTMLPLLFGGDLTGALLTVTTMLIILGVVYLVTVYALVSLALWAAKEMLRTLGRTFRLFTRGLPLLLLGFMFLFINAEAWQSAGQISLVHLGAVATLFILLAAAFLMTQIPREMRGLNDWESWSEIVAHVEEAPVTVDEPPSSAELTAPLGSLEKANLFLVFSVTQGLRLLLVSAMVGALFVVIGLIVISPETITLWTQQSPDVIARYTIFDIDLVLTAELIQVSVFLAFFAAVYFSVYTTTNATLREEFFEDMVGEARQNLAVRAVYRNSL